MTYFEAIARRHPVASYVVLTFATSWGGVLLVTGGPGGMQGPLPEDDPVFPLAVLAMIAGPAVSALVLTALIDGRSGLLEFRSRLLDWRAGPGWYIVALLAAPGLVMVAHAALALVSPEFRPGILLADDAAARVLLGVAVGVAAGVCEELGWTGFAVPQLLRSHGVLATGLIVGLLWSAWHVLVVVWGIGDRAGAIPLPLFVILDGLTFLPAFRVFMVWVYGRTDSLPLGMLLHVSLTATTLILWPDTAGVHLLTFDAVVAAATWAVLAAIALRSGLYLRRPPFGGGSWTGREPAGKHPGGFRCSQPIVRSGVREHPAGWWSSGVGTATAELCPRFDGYPRAGYNNRSSLQSVGQWRSWERA